MNTRYLIDRGGSAVKTRQLSLLFCVPLCLSLLFFAAVGIAGQEGPPAPAEPKPVAIPSVKDAKLPNGLTVAVVERTNVPLVTVQLLVRSGASDEPADKAGLADLTSAMLTKGTAKRSATEIAEQIEFLGGSINSGAGWNNSSVSVTVTSDKLDAAMDILADVVLNPSFSQEELNLLKSQTLDELKATLKQPGSLASYISSAYSYGEHPAGGTPGSIAAITRSDIVNFHAAAFRPERAFIVFAGDISSAKATDLAKKLFGSWRGPSRESSSARVGKAAAHADEKSSTPNRILVVDLPNSGQASVTYHKQIDAVGRTSPAYYEASVLNSLLGGGYSSRLNQEIRIKRGLSYGAGSSFFWRPDKVNFATTRTQTKNESAAEVAELVIGEVRRLASEAAASAELVPRKSVLTGNFGRALETTAGLANAVGELYLFGIPSTALNDYVGRVNSVDDAKVKAFAGKYLLGGDLIIVGDYSVFQADLKKRFPNAEIKVVKADDVDLSKLSGH